MGVLKIVTLIFTLASFVLLLIANLGTTFDSTFLPSIYLVQLNESVTGRYIRYGVYNSCLYYPNSKVAHSCTKKLPGYSFDAKQFAEACGADLANTDIVQPFIDVVGTAKLGTFKFILLIMPAVILAFLALLSTVLMGKMRKNNVISFVGTFTSLFGFFAGGAGLALTIFTFWKGIEVLEQRVEGLSHQWGISIYLVGAGSGFLLFACVCFIMSLFSDSTDNSKRETFHLYDYGNGEENASISKPYDTTTKLITPVKHDSYNDYYHAVPSTTTQAYPSYNQQYQSQQQQYQQQQYKTNKNDSDYQHGNYY